MSSDMREASTDADRRRQGLRARGAESRRRRHWARACPPIRRSNELCWLRVVTDEGIDGWALSDHGHIVADVTRRCLVDAVKGEDPLLKERLWRRVWDIDRAEELPIYALGLLDVALWDITGKVAGMPLYRLLGGASDRCPAYASTATWPTQEDYLRRAEQVPRARVSGRSSSTPGGTRDADARSGARAPRARGRRGRR